MSLDSKDKVIINALKERFKEVQMNLFPTEIGIAPQTPTPDSATPASVEKEIIDVITNLAALPPPSPREADNIGFHISTDTPMRNFLELHTARLPISVSDWYRAIQMLSIHKNTQIPTGRWEVWNRIYKPLAEAESRSSGDDLTNTYIYKSGKSKGTTKEGKITYHYRDDNMLCLLFSNDSLTKNVYETLLGEGFAVLFKNNSILVPFGLIKPVLDFLESTKLVSGKTLPKTALKGIKELRTKISTWRKETERRGGSIVLKTPDMKIKKAYIFLKKFTNALERTVSTQAITRASLIDEVMECCTGAEQVVKILEMGKRGASIWGTIPYMLYWPYNKPQRSKSVLYLNAYKSQFPESVWDGYGGGIMIDQIDRFTEKVREIPDSKLGKPYSWKESLLFIAKTLKRVNDVVWKIPQKTVQKPVAIPTETTTTRPKPAGGTGGLRRRKPVEISKTDKEKALELLMDFSTNYSKKVLENIRSGNIPDTQLKLILEVNEAMSKIPSSQLISGVSFLPVGLSEEYERKNYNLVGRLTKIDGMEPLIIPVAKEYASKWYFLLPKKAKRKPRITALFKKDLGLWYKGANYVSTKNWTGKTAIGENDAGTIVWANYSPLDAPSNFLTDRVREFDQKGAYAFAYAARAVLLRRQPILDECEELQTLWGKGEFKDVLDTKLLNKIKNMIPPSFEAEGIIPSKKLGGKPQKVKFRPYEYQQIGSAFAWLAGGRAYIADIMGLGKTIQGLLFLAIGEREGKDVYPALIVCPAGLVDNWIKEIRSWLPNKSVSKLTEWQDTDLRVTSFDGMKNNKNRIKDIEFRTLIVDEAHYGKNASSGRSKVMRDIATTSNDDGDFATPYVLLLSGTPMENRVDELWAQLYAIEPLKFPTKKSFQEAFSPKNVIKTKQGIRIEVEDKEAVKSKDLRAKLSKELRCVMIRRLKQDVQTTLKLPTKTRVMVSADVGNEGRRIYEEMKDNVIKVVAASLKARYARQIAQMIKGGIPPEEAKNVISEYLSDTEQADLLKNIQETVIAVYGYMRRAAGEAKIPVATQWIKSWFEKKKKPLLIWVEHQKVLNSMKDALDAIGIKYGIIDGSVGSKERSELVEQFQGGDLDVMLLTKAAREGLTLTRASDALFVERWLVPTWEEQAEDRIYRIGQKDDVNIYYLQFHGSFDDKTEAMIKTKRKDIEAVVGEEATATDADDASIQDSVITTIAKDLAKRLQAEMASAPLTLKELMPSDSEIKKILQEIGAVREFLQVYSKPTIESEIVYRSKEPSSRAKKRKAVWDLIPKKGIPYMTLVSKKAVSGSSISALKKNNEIRVTREKMAIPIAKVKTSKAIKELIDKAILLPNNRIPMFDAVEMVGKNNITKMIKDGIAIIAQQEIEL